MYGLRPIPSPQPTRCGILRNWTCPGLFVASRVHCAGRQVSGFWAIWVTSRLCIPITMSPTVKQRIESYMLDLELAQNAWNSLTHAPTWLLGLGAFSSQHLGVCSLGSQHSKSYIGGSWDFRAN